MGAADQPLIKSHQLFVIALRHRSLVHLHALNCKLSRSDALAQLRGNPLGVIGVPVLASELDAPPAIWRKTIQAPWPPLP